MSKDAGIEHTNLPSDPPLGSPLNWELTFAFNPLRALGRLDRALHGHLEHADRMVWGTSSSGSSQTRHLPIP
eukprot:15436856-Alexandrium_andersonii.AAC.1